MGSIGLSFRIHNYHNYVKNHFKERVGKSGCDLSCVH